MSPRLIVASVLLAWAHAASATVLYDLEGDEASFQYQSPDFVVTDRIVAAGSLQQPSPGVSSVLLAPSCPNALPNQKNCDEIDVFFDGGGSLGYFFDDGALGADGIYQSIAYNLATLTVSGAPDGSGTNPAAVAEPATLALLAPALLTLAVRRRRG